jgi:hypothetical protein
MLPADPGHAGEVAGVAQRDGEHVEASERDRGSPHADPLVVVAVDHRVLGVVGDDPQQVEREHPPAGPLDLPADRRERHRDAERERDAEERLRQREEALEERVGDRDRESRERQQQCGRFVNSTSTNATAARAPATASASRGGTSPVTSGRPRVRATCAS